MLQLLITVVGENSGTRSCAVSSTYTPNNYIYCMSGINKLVMDNGQDVDIGTKPDLVLKDKE